MSDPHVVVDNSVRDTPDSHGTANVGSGHQTQWYDGDGYRYSTDNGGSSNGHWTNQDVDKGDSGRHDSPSDARK